MAKNIVIVGLPGSGKTAVATAMAHAHGGRVMADYAIEACDAFREDDPAAPGATRDARYKWDWVRDGWDPVRAYTCGLLILDELAKKLDARKSRGIDGAARDLSIYFRQRHVTIIATAQLARMFDVIYREMCDVIAKVEKKERPLIGLLGATRPDHVCKWCARVMDPGSVSEWDGFMSRKTHRVWWKRLLRYGTRFEWAAWKPAQLDDTGVPFVGASPEATGAVSWSAKLGLLYDSQGGVQDDPAARAAELEGWRITGTGADGRPTCACDAIVADRRAAAAEKKAKRSKKAEKQASTLTPGESGGKVAADNTPGQATL